MKDIYIAATHAVFAPPAMERLAKCDFTKLAVTDTIPLGNRADAIKDRLVVLSVAGAGWRGDPSDSPQPERSASCLDKDTNGI